MAKTDSVLPEPLGACESLQEYVKRCRTECICGRLPISASEDHRPECPVTKAQERWRKGPENRARVLELLKSPPASTAGLPPDYAIPPLG